MIKRGNPYESFKNDRDRLFALMSRDIRIVLVAALIAGATGATPMLSAVLVRWML
jgi:hypothetical protein